MIEIVYCDGLFGFSVNYGFGVVKDWDWIVVVVEEIICVKVMMFLFFGIGMIEDLNCVFDFGVCFVRIVIYCIEVDIFK